MVEIPRPLVNVGMQGRVLLNQLIVVVLGLFPLCGLNDGGLVSSGIGGSHSSCDELGRFWY